MKDFYVYLHKKRSNNEVFYVGKGTGNRSNKKGGRSAFWTNVVIKHSYYIEFAATGLQEWYAYELEKELIAKYGLFKDGGTLVNLSYGGEGHPVGVELKTETRIKISKALKDKPKSKEHKLSVSVGLKKYYKDNTVKRSPCSEQTKLKIGESNKGKLQGVFNHQARSCLCIETGIVFEYINAAAEWCRSQGNPKAVGSQISKNCKGKSKSAYGYTWSYIGEKQ